MGVVIIPVRTAIARLVSEVVEAGVAGRAGVLRDVLEEGVRERVLDTDSLLVVETQEPLE